MAGERTRVGLHARNDVTFTERDYELVRRAKIETMKMMSFTDPSVFERLRRENPDIEFIVRLYDDRFHPDSPPTPADFCTRMLPFINRLQPYTTKFEIHNEPNHVARIEGWGATDDDARNFRSWYLQVLPLLRQAAPWASFGFPGLALNHPHRDLEWLKICSDAVKASDWLGCHCYWQYNNMLHDQWGLRFKLYHDRFPKKRIEITEFGNSTPNLPAQDMAQQYARYYTELNKYPYLGSASAFIASSPDTTWAPFVWLKEGGEMLPVAFSVGDMARPPLKTVPVKPTPVEPTPVKPTPVEPVKPAPVEPVKPVPPKPTQRLFPETGKTVRGAFLEFFDNYGLDICGYPITEQFEEAGFPSQYFQRVAIEQLKSGKMRLKLVGTEAWTSRPRIAELEAMIKELSQRPPATGVGRPPIVDLVDELPRHASKRYPTRAEATIRQIVVHHTATSPTITPQRLAEYQVRTLDKPAIAYHFVVAADGTIYQTNLLETVADHAYGKSADSVGVVFPGNFTEVIPTQAQIDAGARLIAWLLDALRLAPAAIVGLSELIATQSPGKQWLSGQKWKNTLLQRVDQALEAGEGEDQSALISSLRARIQKLEAEIEQLREEAATPPTPTPVPVPTPTPTPTPVGVVKPAIQDLIDKLPKHATNRYNTRKLNAIDTLVIHHSAVPPTVGPQRMADYHVKNLEWPGLGYHFMVGEDGIVYQGNNLQTVSYHTGRANGHCVGICFLGNFTQSVPPPEQLRAGARLVAWLMQELDIDLDSVKGHKEMLATQCPGKQWFEGKKWKEMLRREIAAVQQEAAQPAPTPTPTPLPVPAGGKTLYHYLLFWSHDGKWADRDWVNAAGYIGAFHPSAGVSAQDAAQAEYVTIVGGPLGVSKEVEEWLRSAGSKVERIAGKDEADTRRLLDELVEQGRRFRTFDE